MPHGPRESNLDPLQEQVVFLPAAPLMNHPASIVFMAKTVSQGLGYAPLVTLTTNGSVLPVPEMTIMSLFQEVVRTNLLCSAPLTLPIFPDKSPI